jgi:hypothetical protein
MLGRHSVEAGSNSKNAHNRNRKKPIDTHTSQCDEIVLARKFQWDIKNEELT